MKTIKTIIIIISLLILLGGSVYILAFHVFSGLGSRFNKECSKITVGMDRAEVLERMKPFETPPKYSFKETEELISYATEGFGGEYQCYIYLTPENKVKSAMGIFD